MDNQEYQPHFTGEITEPEAPEEDDEMQRALADLARVQNAEGWRILLAAHDHVWRDLQWGWRVRFDTCSFLWNRALDMCRENMIGRVA